MLCFPQKKKKKKKKSLISFFTVIRIGDYSLKKYALAALELTEEKILTVQMTGDGQNL
jgi:hypothetical protein